MNRSLIPYKVSGSFLDGLQVIDTTRTIRSITSTWAFLSLLVLGLRFLIPPSSFWYFYIPFIFLIAGRMGALLQGVHEATHNLISKFPRRNRMLGAWFCAYPIGVNYDGYVRGHLKHHAYTGTERDPPSDTEKYRITDVRDPKLYLLFLKDIFGITALSVFMSYTGNEAESKQRRGDAQSGMASFRTLGCVSLVQLFVLGILFQFQIDDYILLWIIPAMSPHMFLMRVRGMAEHGLAKQKGVTVANHLEGNYYTRSFLTSKRAYRFLPLVWIEKTLIGSLSVYYHHEHHAYPEVPFYYLRRLHQEISAAVVAENPDVYASGYFSAAMRNLFEGYPVLLPLAGESCDT